MSELPAAVLVCPGRGSYGREELGSLARDVRPGPVLDALRRADAARQARGEPTVSELDGLASFRPGVHLAGPNAAALIYFATLARVERLRERYRVVAVAGNSLGWYTALAVAGVLSAHDGWRLIRTMADLQAKAPGGQILTSVVAEGDTTTVAGSVTFPASGPQSGQTVDAATGSMSKNDNLVQFELTELSIGVACITSPCPPQPVEGTVSGCVRWQKIQF